jgi:acetoacetyl-CoA synthetase
VAEVADALIVHLDLPGGGSFMPLFVTLTEGAVLDDALTRTITERLRGQYTARHVPDRVIRVDAIPATLTGKKMEVPVRRILLGVPLDEAANRNAMVNPQALDAFAEYAKTQQDYRLGD